jgi:hypothetical protein
LLAAAVLLSAAAAADAQPPAATDVQTLDPIRCWWRTSAGAVATGEPFEASLTCAVQDDEAAAVAVDEMRLGALAIQLGAFEVLGGTHPADLRTATHRFFQYHYTLRVIDRDLIGKDATFPDLHVSYRVHSRAGGEASEGRERTYLIPGQSIRVLSLVPGPASDIRDAAGRSFARVEALRFRSRALQIGALGLAALGVIVLVPALLALGRHGRRGAKQETGLPSTSRVLASAARELSEVAGAARGGWTTDLAARAAAAIRLAAACALGRRVSHRPETDARVAPGRLLVQTGLLRRQRAAASSAVTTASLRAAIDRLPLTTPAESRETLERLHRALAAFTAALYRQSFEPEAALDDAVRSAQQTTARLRRAHAWPRRLGRPRVAVQSTESVAQ